MRSYFLTGCTGFIGREITRQLLADETTERVVCLTRGQRGGLLFHPKLEYHHGDITNCDFPQEHFTDLIHGANDANDLMQPDQYRYYHTIVEGTARVLEWSRKRRIDNTLILSSGAASRDTIYGRAKVICEKMAWMNYGNNKIARIYSVIGEEMPLNGQFAAGRFVWQALQGKVEYYGGESLRTYLHVQDCAAWVLRILSNGKALIPYEIAGDTQISVEELAIMVAHEFGAKLSNIPGPKRIDSYLPDIFSSYHLGCRQTITIEESLRRIHAHLRNPDIQSPGGTAYCNPVDSGSDRPQHSEYTVQYRNCR